MKKRVNAKILLQLFTSMLYISAFTFGGGFVIVTFMKQRFVDRLHWLDEQEMLDLIAIAQSSPGAIAVNAAILVGWRLSGALGMVVAVIGTILPPMIVLSVISFFYAAFAANRYVALFLKGMQAGGHVLKNKSWIHDAMMVAAFVAAFFLDVNVVLIILAAAVIGIVLALVKRGPAV